MIKVMDARSRRYLLGGALVVAAIASVFLRPVFEGLLSPKPNEEADRQYEERSLAIVNDIRKTQGRAPIINQQASATQDRAAVTMSPSEARKRQWSQQELTTLLGNKPEEEVKKLLGPPDAVDANGSLYIYTKMKIMNPDTERNDNTLWVEFVFSRGPFGAIGNSVTFHNK